MSADSLGVLEHYLRLACERAGVKWGSDNEVELADLTSDLRRRLQRAELLEQRFEALRGALLDDQLALRVERLELLAGAQDLEDRLEDGSAAERLDDVEEAVDKLYRDARGGARRKGRRKKR